MQTPGFLPQLRWPPHGGVRGTPRRSRSARSPDPPMGAHASIPASLSLCVRRETHERGPSRLPARPLRRAQAAGTTALGNASPTVRRDQLHPTVCDRATLGCTSRALRARGSALNLNLHFHTLALDGVYTDDRGPGVAPRFLPLPPPDDDAVARVLAGTARRLQRIVAKRAAEDEDALARDEPLLAVLAAASLRGRSASGPNAGERWRRLGDRLVPLIPPPRAHQLRYHGILAPCASRRDQVVPAGAAAFAVAGCGSVTAPVPSIEPSASADPRGTQTTFGAATIGVENADTWAERRPTAPAGATPEVDPHGRPPDRATRRRQRWAELLQRVFEIDALRCPRCGSTLRLIAAIEDPAVARRILECLKLPARSPPIEPASWAAIPPEPVAPDRGADWEFDQSRPAQEDSGLS